jgi:dehydrogenase/reductase SDR family protein 12
MSTIADFVDGTLELAIVPSFTRIGSAVRSRLDHWTPVDQYKLDGRVVVITGATSGLGLAATRALLRNGATVEMLARDARKAAAVCDQLRTEQPAGEVGFVVADTGDLDAVRRAAETIRQRHDRVDVLIHNAGALDREYGQSPQGIEHTVASQVVGPFLLTRLLLPALKAAPRARILFVASGGLYSQPLSVADLEMTLADYDGTKAYARAKRAQATLAEMWAESLQSDGIVVHAMHPGWADTPGVRRSLPTFRRITGPLLRSPEQGADTLVWLAADDGAPLETTGRFWLDRRPRPIHRLPSTRRSDVPDERTRLWAWCEARSHAEDGNQFVVGQ